MFSRQFAAQWAAADYLDRNAPRFFAALVRRSSRNNRFTARGLAKVLELFAPHAKLLRSGDGALFKTGTFSGVRCEISSYGA